MTNHEKISFEIGGHNLIRLEPLQYLFTDSEHDWDLNWIKTRVTVKGGIFSGQYVAEFMTTDFEKLKRDLRRFDNGDFKGKAKFEPLEGQLVVEIEGEALDALKSFVLFVMSLILVLGLSTLWALIRRN